MKKQFRLFDDEKQKKRIDKVATSMWRKNVVFGFYTVE